MARTFAMLIAIAFIGGCASQTKLREAELAQLLEWYAGRYVNVEQVKADVAAHREPHAALELNIVRVYAPLAGDFAFYVQESAAEDPRRVFTQRIVAFSTVKDRGIVQSLWSFTEPTRWRDAHLDKDLFKGLMPQDFTQMGGCDLLWKKKDSSFEGANDAKTCRVSSAAAEGTVTMDLRAELTQDELALSDQTYDLAGKRVQGSAGDPFYRFKRR
jgi:hypothetical protein